MFASSLLLELGLDRLLSRKRARLRWEIQVDWNYASRFLNTRERVLHNHTFTDSSVACDEEWLRCLACADYELNYMWVAHGVDSGHKQREIRRVFLVLEGRDSFAPVHEFKCLLVNVVFKYSVIQRDVELSEDAPEEVVYLALCYVLKWASKSPEERKCIVGN